MENLRGLTGADFLDFRLINIFDDGDRQGAACVVKINAEFAVLLERLHRQDRDGEDKGMEILNANFNMAKTICHEVWHLVHLSTSPDDARNSQFLYIHRTTDNETGPWPAPNIDHYSKMRVSLSSATVARIMSLADKWTGNFQTHARCRACATGQTGL